jgi:hypothetical protein
MFWATNPSKVATRSLFLGKNSDNPTSSPFEKELLSLRFSHLKTGEIQGMSSVQEA